MNMITKCADAPERGRCFVADRTYKKDEVILEEYPCAMVISDHFVSQGVCAYCAGFPHASGKVFAPWEEDWSRYCTEKCMKNDFDVHKTEMRATKRFFEHGVQGSTDAMRLVLKLGAMLQSQNRIEKERKRDKETIDLILTLDDGNSKERLDEDERGMMRQIAQVLFASGAQIEIDDSGTSSGAKVDILESADQAEYFLYVVQCNAHRIVDQTGQPVALGLFPLVSMLNHSCDFNAEHRFSWTSLSSSTSQNKTVPKLQIIAAKDIAEGEEICYSYIPHDLDTASRQAILKKTYGFNCNCTKCVQ
jgi:[histone H3]-lysine4/36 N-trimethyltransferase SMYD